MKIRILIAGAAVMLLCGGLGVGVAEEADPRRRHRLPPCVRSHPPKPKHHREHHHGKHHAAREFSEQQLQEMQAHPPSK